MDLLSVIIQPAINEKSTINQEKGQYSFFVRNKATKIDIKNAFKLMFGVKPDKVRVINEPKKIRLIGRNKFTTKRHARKKAIVFVKGKKLDINKFKI